MDQTLPLMNQKQDPNDPNATGTHEEFWVFSQVSQWGSNWKYFDTHYLNDVRDVAIKARTIGVEAGHPARMVHYTQMLLWRFYLKEDFDKSTCIDVLDVAFESASKMLEHQNSNANKDKYHPVRSAAQQQQQMNDHTKLSEFRQHFKLVLALDFNIRIKHPSEFLSLFATNDFTERHFQIAERIISDSYLSPCCLLHPPIRIAEGAAVMAAGMTNQPNIVIPKDPKSISFIQDMQCFYLQSI